MLSINGTCYGYGQSSVKYVRFLLRLKTVETLKIFVLFTGQNCKGAKNGCVIIAIGFDSLAAVATFLEDSISGALTEHFRPIQEAARRFPGYENFAIKAKIRDETFGTFLNGLGKVFFI